MDESFTIFINYNLKLNNTKLIAIKIFFVCVERVRTLFATTMTGFCSLEKNKKKIMNPFAECSMRRARGNKQNKKKQKRIYLRK